MKRDAARSINRKEFEDLLELGVKKLKSFGFIHVTKENIVLDEVYLFFFLRLADSLRGRTKALDAQIDRFLAIINKKK